MEKETANPQEYSANFKLRVILDVLNNGLSIHEAVRKYWDVTSHCVRNMLSTYIGNKAFSKMFFAVNQVTMGICCIGGKDFRSLFV